MKAVAPSGRNRIELLDRTRESHGGGAGAGEVRRSSPVRTWVVSYGWLRVGSARSSLAANCLTPMTLATASRCRFGETPFQDGRDLALDCGRHPSHSRESRSAIPGNHAGQRRMRSPRLRPRRTPSAALPAPPTPAILAATPAAGRTRTADRGRADGAGHRLRPARRRSVAAARPTRGAPRAEPASR